MNYILVDTNKKKLLPLTYTRPLSDLRVGIFKIGEKWSKYLGAPVSYLCDDYLQASFPLKTEKKNVFINSKFLPNPELREQIELLKVGQKLIYGNEWVACCLENNELLISSSMPAIPAFVDVVVENWWDLMKVNGQEIENDLKHLIVQPSDGLSISNTVIGSRKKLFIHPSAKIEGVIFNTTYGAIYIGEQTEVMEGSVIRGPFALLNNGTVKMGAKIYSGTTIGQFCKVGGEIKNCIINDYTNKSHDGYLGNSVLGSWINLGANTNCSNLKNTASSVSVWNYIDKKMEDTNELFLGCVIGDYSKLAINTSLNTGTTLGVNCNVFGAGFPAKFIPNFSWGFDDRERYKISNALENIKKWSSLSGNLVQESDLNILKHLHHRQE